MKEFIKNRKDQKIAVIVEENPEHKGLAFVMHGLGGFKEQPQLQTFAKAFKDNGYTIVMFDTTSTAGESDGRFEDATVGGYYNDLEDVIAWAKTQSWYMEPFCLSGHSLGGYSSILFAVKYPEQVKTIIPTQTFISGKLSMEAAPSEELKAWKETGWQIKESKSKPGFIKRSPWSHMEERLNHDLLKEGLKKLVMPVLLISGDLDKSVPIEHQMLIYERLPGKKEIYTVKGAGHGFYSKEHLDEVYGVFDNWIKNL